MLLIVEFVWGAYRVIQCKKVSKTYGSALHRVVALDQLEIQIDSLEKVAIVGRSGSGKTTLLNLLSGLDRPTSGSLSVNGMDLGQLDSAAMADYRLKTVGVVFQSFQLISQRTAAQNVELPLIIAGEPAEVRAKKVSQSLRKVGLGDRAHHFPYQLSGGEQQRVAIARAVVKQPRVMLADEPTGNLDSKTAAEIMQLLMHICENEALTLVLITHDLELAGKYTDRQSVKDDGKLTETKSARNGTVAASVDCP